MSERADPAIRSICYQACSIPPRCHEDVTPAATPPRRRSTRRLGRGRTSAFAIGKSMTGFEPRIGLIEDVRLLVYSELAGAGRVDGADSLAARLDVPRSVVDQSLRHLQDSRDLVLNDHGEILLAHPFAMRNFGFSVMGKDVLWWAGAPGTRSRSSPRTRRASGPRCHTVPGLRHTARVERHPRRVHPGRPGRLLCYADAPRLG